MLVLKRQNLKSPKSKYFYTHTSFSSTNQDLCVVHMVRVYCKRDILELQKRADRADQLVLFFLAGANFWENHAKNRQKHAKTGKKQRFFGANFFVGKIGRC